MWTFELVWTLGGCSRWVTWSVRHGTIVFVGRKDTQVRVQSHRFEHTEIEVRLASVLPPGSKFYVGKVENHHSSLNQDPLFVFVSTSMKVSAGKHTKICWDRVESALERVPEVRANLTKVPLKPMIPFLYVPMSSIVPLTASPKTNRKVLRLLVEHLNFSEVQRLRKPDKSEDETKSLSHNELTLREPWALVLDQKPETIGSDDNFIQLGGDSVTSIRLISAAAGSLTPTVIVSTPVLSEKARKASIPDGLGHQERVRPFALLEGRSEIFRTSAGATCRLPVGAGEALFGRGKWLALTDPG